MSSTVDDVWAGVVGQDRAVTQLAAAVAHPVHSYLFVGPAGSGKRAAARAFAALLLTDGADWEEAERHSRLALAEAHPDLHVIDPSLATGGISTKDARDIVKQAVLSPSEGARKVILLEDFHFIGDAAAVLLKYVEEPPASTYFVILAEDVPPELVTIASRSVRIDFGHVPLTEVVHQLVAEGVGESQAESIAAASAGDLDRARLLATDARFAVRAEALGAMPSRLDGTGARAAELAAEVKALIDDAQAVIDARHEREVAELEERIERYGQRGSGKREIVDRHKQEVRRHRTAELRFALATFAAVYRDALATARHPDRIVAGIHRIEAAALSLERFPNEALLLQALLAHLPPLER